MPNRLTIALLFLGAATLHAQEALSLEEAVAQALQHNLALQIQRLQPPIAEQAVMIEASVFDVRFDGEGSYHRSSREIVGATTDATEFEQDSVRVGASKLLNTGGTATLSTSLQRTETRGSGASLLPQLYESTLALRIAQPLLQGAWSGVNLARLRQAQSDLAAEQLRLRAVALDLTLEVTRRYWALSHAIARRDLTLSSIEAAQQLVNEMDARSQRGLATPIEVLQAQASLAERKEELIQAENAIADASDDLSEAMGRLLQAPGPRHAPAVAELPRTAVPLPDFAVMWPQVLEEDLDSRIQEEAIARNDLQRLIEADSKRVRLDAYAEGALLGSDPSVSGRAYRSAADRDGHAWTAGLQFSVPWGQREGIARTRRADLVIEQAQIRLIELKQELYKRSRSAWRAVEAGNERLKSARARLDFEEGAHAQARARYDRGLTSFRELLEAQRDLDAARLVYIGVLRDLSVARSTLARLDGSLFQQFTFPGSPVPQVQSQE